MSRTYPTKESITGVILAGGQARRMGGLDKGLVPFNGRPLVEWAIEALRPQVGTLLISANRNLERYASYGLAVISDLEPGFRGPLAGFDSAMQAAGTDWILTVPCDGPYPAPDLVKRLALALRDPGTELAVATDGARMQPVHALLPVSLAASLKTFMAAGERKVDRWYARHRVALADFSDRPDCFVNINSPSDAEGLGQSGSPSPGDSRIGAPIWHACSRVAGVGWGISQGINAISRPHFQPMRRGPAGDYLIRTGRYGKHGRS